MDFLVPDDQVAVLRRVANARGVLRNKPSADGRPSECWMARMALGLSGSFSAMANCSAIFHCIWLAMASLAVTMGASARWLVFIASLRRRVRFSVPDFVIGVWRGKMSLLERNRMSFADKAGNAAAHTM